MTTDTQLTIAQELDQALVAKGVTEEVIEKLMQRALPHAQPIENDEQYKAAEEARKEIKKVRLIGEKGIEAVDRRYLDLRQASLAKKKELLAKINEPELLIEVHTKAYEKKKAEEQAERERLIQEMQEKRKFDLMALGFRFIPGPPEHRYALEDTSWSAREVIEADHETWTNMLRSARMVAEEIAAAKAEEERKANEERERIAAEQEALRKQQEEMARKEAEMKAREEAMQRQVNEVRKGELMALGCEEWVSGGRVCIGIDPHAIDGFAVWADELHAIDDARWANYILEAKAVVEERNLAIKAEQERLDAEAKREALIKERVEKLKSAGWEQSSLSNHVSLEENGHIAISLKEHDLFAFNEDVIAGYVNRGHAELARRKAAQEEDIEKERQRVEEEAIAEALKGGDIIMMQRPALADWIPVDEFVLEDRARYLVATDNGDVTLARYNENYLDVWIDLTDRDYFAVTGVVTHIIPFPKHPNHGN